jgi:hypothetical protein
MNPPPPPRAVMPVLSPPSRTGGLPVDPVGPEVAAGSESGRAEVNLSDVLLVRS